ncbi:hypothetical protein CCP4SC76_4470005 [Gammaproteobacteria bacterium]
MRVVSGFSVAPVNSQGLGRAKGYDGEGIGGSVYYGLSGMARFGTAKFRYNSEKPNDDN